MNFRDFEHAGWEKLPARYHDAFGKLTSQAIGPLLDAIRMRGNLQADLPAGPPFFRFSEAGECRRALVEAGFDNPEVKPVPQTWRLDSPEALFEIMLGSTVRTGALLRAQAPAALEAIRAEVTAASRKELPMPAVLASATRRSV